MSCSEPVTLITSRTHFLLTQPVFLLYPPWQWTQQLKVTTEVTGKKLGFFWGGGNPGGLVVFSEIYLILQVKFFAKVCECLLFVILDARLLLQQDQFNLKFAS